MSYAVVNPPPTAAPLPVIASANENTPYWAPAGSGGGGGGSQISSSGAYVLCSTNGLLVMGNTVDATTRDIQIGDNNYTVGVSLQNLTNDSITLYNGVIGFSTSNVNMNTNLNVSSINGTTFASANTRFGSAVIPAGGSTVRQLSPPYASPNFYTQLTYAGPQMGPASTLSAVATNLSSVTIYGEEGMLVNYLIIG